MARFVGTETQRIRADWWDEDEWVEIRKLSFLDRRTIAGRSTTYGPVREDGGRSVFVDTGAMDLAIMELGIVDWRLVSEQGELMPLGEAALRRLGEEDGAYIVNAIHEYNPRRSAEEQASF